jgi:hypothetical protein
MFRCISSAVLAETTLMLMLELDKKRNTVRSRVCSIGNNAPTYIRYIASDQVHESFQRLDYVELLRELTNATFAVSIIFLDGVSINIHHIGRF